MARLHDKKTRQYLGKISDEDWQFLADNLEEEGLADADYHISPATVDLLKEKGMSKDLARLVENAMGGNKDIEMAYERI